VLELPSGEVLFHVEGHTAVVTAVAFCRHLPQLLVTAAEDRTFKVWDLEAGTLYYQSAILCAAALTCLAIDPLYNRVAVGAADGVVRFFDLSTAACAQLQVYDSCLSPFSHAEPRRNGQPSLPR
jgi:WD40 repeat protein